MELLYLAGSGREAFIKESALALVGNTSWDSFSAAHVYLDGKWSNWANAMAVSIPAHVKVHFWRAEFGGPVQIMNHYLSVCPANTTFVKIDDDVMLPPGWDLKVWGVMDRHPELGFLGIEPYMSRTPAPWALQRAVPKPDRDGPVVMADNIKASDLPVTEKYVTSGFCGYAPTEAVGGIGAFRARAFYGRSAMIQHSKYGGFTDWQIAHPEIVKGWLYPAMPIFLLDRLPFEPWLKLSKQYIADGKQRPWTNYPDDTKGLWEWWCDSMTPM